MANKPSHTAAAWTEVEYSSLCISPYLSTPVFVPKETSFYLCREGGERKPARLTFVVFKAQEASDDEWEDDPMLGNIMAEVLGDGNEEVEPVSMVNLGMEPSSFISVVREDDNVIVFDIYWPDGEVKIDKGELTDEGFVLKKSDFGDDGLLCNLIPDEGKPFSLRLVLPYVGFSLIDADENAVSGDISVTPDTIDLYSYTFVGNDGNDRFALSLDDDKLKYLCVLRDDGTMAVRDMRDRLTEVSQIPDRGKLSQLMMGAHSLLIKNKNSRWRVTLTGEDVEEANELECNAVALARFAFEKYTATDNVDEDALAQTLMSLEQKMAFQWFWLDEADWSHEHMEGLLDMEGLDADPEKMMRQALLFNRYEQFMKRLAAFSYIMQKPIQGDQLQARNNKRKIARCARHIIAHRAGTENIWKLDEDARREIQHFFSTFHREFTELLEAENGNAA